MKKGIASVLTITMVMALGLAFTGCSSDDGATVDETMDTATVTEEVIINDSAALTTDEMVDELAQMTADKYGITKEEYIQQTEDAGKTVMEEMQTEADVMGLSIEELYEYEKENAGTMTDEQKEMMEGMGEAQDAIDSTMSSTE